MREWNLSLNDPLYLILAADSRLTKPDYCDDQIWELSLSNGDPPSIRLYTNFGLRTRSFQIYPRFIENNQIIYDPLTFVRKPALRQLYPNFISLECSPFPEIDVELSYWVPNSKSIVIKLKIINHSQISRQIKLEWNAILIPSDNGEPMAPMEIKAARVLAGRTNNLIPLVLLTSGSGSVIGSHQTLSQIIDLAPHNIQELMLGHAALTTLEESFDAARQVVTSNWDAEIARIELQNCDQIEIYTGDPDWDVAFALSQNLAYSLFMGPTDHLPERSFVLSRRTDQGFSLTGDGRDYGYLWNGQTSFDVYTLINLILPGSPDLAKGLLRNFISSQTEIGEIDWKPGLSGQKSNTLITPLLATLTWKLYLYCEDKVFLENMFPHLLSYIYAWLSENHDRDEDGIPEWDQPLQAGIEDHPLFSKWQSWSQGHDISCVEGPLMSSYLFSEYQSLLKIAESLSIKDSIPEITSRADDICAILNSAWNEEEATYHYWDRDTHNISSHRILSEIQGATIPSFQITFDKPVRINFQIKSETEITRRLNIFIHGVSQSGKHRVEHITPDQIHWYIGIGYTTSSSTYTHIEHIEFQGIDITDKIKIFIADLDFRDITQLMPLWANICLSTQAQALVRKTITNPFQYWREFGLPTFPDLHQEIFGQLINQVNIPWNLMIGEGLMNYGYRSEAAILVTKIMKAIIQNLKSENAFFGYYDSNNGKGFGDKNSLNGLAPINLFLDTLGVRIFSPTKVAIEGLNPFPWTVRLIYKGLKVIRHDEDTEITFPNNESINIHDANPRLIYIDPGTNQMKFN